MRRPATVEVESATPVPEHDPFRSAAGAYRERGWLGTIPLPAGQKHPPPSGLTGRAAEYPDEAQIAEWSAMPRYKGGNLALHLGLTPDAAYEVIGIDVDDYGEKQGGTQLKELESELGDLPATWISTSRALPSGIRFFRAPVGYAFRGRAAEGIDIIQRVHRYAVVWPSWNPDSAAPYGWVDRDGREVADVAGLPYVDDLPVLSEAWVQFLTRDGMPDAGVVPIDMDSSNDEVAEWIERTVSSSETGLCTRMQKARNKWVTAMEHEESSHDKILSAQWELVRLGVEGHRGLMAAMATVGDTFVRVTTERGKRSFDELRSEVGRSYWGALRKTKGELDNPEIGPYVAPCDTCAPRRNVNATRRASRSLASVTPAPVRWLWKGWLPIGKVSLFEGDPDVGKSTVTIDWAATVTTGRQWPQTVIGDKVLVSQGDPAGVLLVGAEDGYEDTVVPRLIASGADLNRVHALERPLDSTGKPVPFTIPDDIAWLRQAVEESEAKLVVIDPITACLPENTKHGVDAEIRRILQYLSDLAAERDCAIVLIRHFNKASGMSAKHRGGGSIAYTAVVRSVLSAAVLKEPGAHDETHAIARAKGNLSKEPRAIGYSLVKAPDHPDLPTPEDDELGVSVVSWGGPLDMNADQLVGADGAKAADARKRAPLRDECEALLRELLADGPMKAEEAIAKTRDAVGCSAKPVKDAANVIGVVREAVRVDGRVDCWTWRLPLLKVQRGQMDREPE